MGGIAKRLNRIPEKNLLEKSSGLGPSGRGGSGSKRRLGPSDFVLTKTMKQFSCSVFDGPVSGIISRVFDVRRAFWLGVFSAVRYSSRNILYFCLGFDVRSLLFLTCTVVSLCRALRAATQIEKSVFCLA